jgi:pimeloyl-ACP methyl ester carboxylesterase
MSTQTGAVVSAMLLLVGARSGLRRALEGEVEKRTIGTFNSIPDPRRPGPPGTLIREERLLGALDGAMTRLSAHSREGASRHRRPADRQVPRRRSEHHRAVGHVAQTEHAGGSPVGVPMLVTQGDSDQLVKPASAQQYVNQLCADGEHVELRTYEHIDHGPIVERTVSLLLTWLADISDGRTPSSTCASGAH